MATRRMAVANFVPFVFTVVSISAACLFAFGNTSVFPKTWGLMIKAPVDDYGSRSFLLNYPPSDNDILTSDTHMSTLNVASRIFVINLLHRTDRRTRMELLRSVLGLDFTYIDALHSANPLVEIIMGRVRELRAGYKVLDDTEPGGTDSHAPTIRSPEFSWPEDIDTIAYSFDSLGRHGSDLWEDDIFSQSSSQPDPGAKFTLLTSAYDNDTVEAYNPALPPHRILTAGKIACWYSHLKAIRQIAEGAVNNLTEVSVVLEDDIDMELDIRQRLAGLWNSLPNDWDIVFLGHCWSDESRRPAVKIYNSSLSGPTSSATALHPSISPKCTHGYALTTQGARRLAVYLRHPPFAYSRAVDQAIAWLVKSGRLKSYSLVPSVVVQRKTDKSDILDGTGSDWKDVLNRGVFG